MTDLKLASIKELCEELINRVRCGVIVLNWIDEGQKEDTINSGIRRFKGYNHEILGLLNEMEIIIKQKIVTELYTTLLSSEGQSPDEKPLS